MKLSLNSLAFGLVATSLFFVGAGCSGSGDSASKEGETPAAKGGEIPAPGGMLKRGDQSPDKDKIQIGLVASETGGQKPWGDDSVSGALMAVDEINSAGGINGKQVQLLIEDSGSTPEQGKTAAERLIGKGAVALVGEVASGITIQMANAAKDKRIPIVAIGATRTDIPGIGDYVFRVCYTDDLQGPVMATFAFQDLGLKNVAIMTDNKLPYSQYLSKTFKESFIKQGGKIVDEQFYESGQTQFASQLTQLKAKNPEGVFLSGYFTEVGPIVRQAKEAGINAKYMGGDGWDSAEILTTGGDAILGSYFCNHYNDKEDRAEVKAFLDAWKGKIGGVPGTTMGALSYDATKLVIDSMKRAKDAKSSVDVLKAISETEGFKGVSGEVTLKGQGGNPPKRALIVQLTKEGQVFEKAIEAKDVKR